ncbi:MAG: hypothetical protein GXY48_09010 [Methanomicrobiales archaeon]|nr:hypothetical protein [Methanomicrobiales archaeon]
MSSLWIGTITDTYLTGWPESSPYEIKLSAHMDGKKSGTDLNLHEQINHE